MQTFLDMLYASVWHVCMGDEKLNLCASPLKTSPVGHLVLFIQTHLAEIKQLVLVAESDSPVSMSTGATIKTTRRH